MDIFAVASGRIYALPIIAEARFLQPLVKFLKDQGLSAMAFEEEKSDSYHLMLPFPLLPSHNCHHDMVFMLIFTSLLHW
jgi:hypothetical protein